jgi:manganese efflux pump family protein
MSVLLIGVTLGLDSFRAGVGMAALDRSWRLHAWLALAFGICDGLGTLIGVALGEAVSRGFVAAAAGYVGPALLILYGALLIAVPSSAASRVREVGRPWMIVGLPVALSVDNLASSVALGLVQFPAATTAVIIGAVSGAMALAGLRFGAVLLRMFPLPAELAAGVMMLLVGAMLAVD